MASIDDKVEGDRRAAQNRADIITLRRAIIETIQPCVNQSSCDSRTYCNMRTCQDYQASKNYKR